MTDQASIQIVNENLLVSGVINFETAMPLWNSSLPLLTHLNQFNFDFSKVTSVNSASLALLLEWIKYAKLQNKPIFFQNLSPQILSLAKVAEIAELFSNPN